MTELSVPDVAALRGHTPRAVRKAVAQNRLPARRIVNGQGGAGGEQYLIPLSALAPDEQARYWAQFGGQPPTAEIPVMTLPLSRPDRFALVRRYLSGGSRTRADVEALAKEAGVSVSQLYRWIGEARKKGQHAVSIKIDGVQRPRKVRFPRSSVPADDLAAAVGWLLQDPRRSIQDAHARLAEMGHGIGYVQFWRLLDRMDPPLAKLKALASRGGIALRLEETPKILRRWSELPPGHTYVGDQHLLDYQCVLPETGEVVNLQLYLWMDAATTYWTGLAASYGPYTRYTVGLSLLDACRIHVPRALLNDNGRQEKSAYVDELWERIGGVCDLLDPALFDGRRQFVQGERRFTTPNLPPVKPIEAQMAVLTRYLNQEELAGYRKRDADPFRNKERQGQLKKDAKAGELPTVDEVLAALVRVMKRHNTTPTRSEVDQTTYVPAERFWAGLADRRIVLADDDLKTLFYPRFERKVRNATVRIKLGGKVLDFAHPQLAGIPWQEDVRALINPIPPHDGSLALRLDHAGHWQPWCPLEVWAGRGVAPYADRDTMEDLMRQKHAYLARFRDALTDLHAAARAKFAPAAPEPAADKVRYLTHNGRLPHHDQFLLATAARLFPAADPPQDAPDPAPALDHQGALRALMDYRRERCG